MKRGNPQLIKGHKMNLGKHWKVKDTSKMKGLKGKKMSEETKRKLSLALKGHKVSVETKEKLSKSHKNQIPWNKGTKGLYSKEHIQKLKKSRIGKKASEESRKKMSKNNNRFWLGKRGEKHPGWKGGLSFLPYSVDWTETLRLSIRERDHYTCQICGEKQGDNALSVHHKDYNKLNCNPDNLITLCHFCHLNTNRNKEYWIKYFKINPSCQ